MSIFSGITNIAKTAVNAVGQTAVNILDFNKAAFTNPITLITKGPSAAIAASNQLTPVQVAARTIATTSIVAGGVLLGGTTAGRAAVTTVAKAFVPKTPTAIAATALVAPIVATAVVSNPLGAAKTVGNIANFQSNAGQLIANPSIEGAKTLIKENPVISGVVAAGTIAAVGYTSSSVVSNFLNTEAVKKNTAATLEAQKGASVGPSGIPVGVALTSEQSKQLDDYIYAQSHPIQSPAVVAPSVGRAGITGAPAGVVTEKKTVKKKAKKKKKTVKKTRRSKKKTVKKTRRSKKKAKRKVIKKRHTRK